MAREMSADTFFSCVRNNEHNYVSLGQDMEKGQSKWSSNICNECFIFVKNPYSWQYQAPRVVSQFASRSGSTGSVIFSYSKKKGMLYEAYDRSQGANNHHAFLLPDKIEKVAAEFVL